MEIRKSTSRSILGVLGVAVGCLFSGTLSAAVIQVPSEVGTIQLAIEGASAGDTIMVAPGTYVENLNFRGKAITIESTAGPADTTLDASACTLGSEQCSGVVFVSGEGRDSVFRGFTITGGTGTIYEPTRRRGGGVYCNQTSPTIDDCIVVGNSAYNGGGISAYIQASPMIMNCIVNDNVSSNCAGGIDCRNSTPVIQDCMIAGNSCSSCGGGIGAYVGGGPTVTRCVITDNVARLGGGIHSHTGSSATITNCEVTFNVTEVSGSGMSLSGAGIQFVTDSDISDNFSGATGGAAICSGDITLTRCTFYRNIAENDGGAIQALGNVKVVSCDFRDNSADGDGGAVTSINSSGPSPSFVGCLFVGNSAGGDGGAMLSDALSCRVTNCTMTQNTANRGGGISRETGACRLMNTIVYGNTGLQTNDALHGALSLYFVSYCDIEGGADGDGNIDSDPLFVDPGLRDFRLEAGSPCIDSGTPVAGSTLPDLDLGGVPRVVCSIDMGAYEFVNTGDGFIRADVNQDQSIDLGDAITILGALFGGDPLGCEDAADANDDGTLNVADAIRILDHLFSPASPPLPPPVGPRCGDDPTPDSLECLVSLSCCA